MTILSLEPDTEQRCMDLLKIIHKMICERKPRTHATVAAEAKTVPVTVQNLLEFIGADFSALATKKKVKSAIFHLGRRYHIDRALVGDPEAPWQEFAKTFSVVNSVIYADFQWLRKRNFPGIEKRDALKNETAEIKARDEARVCEYMLANPGVLFADAARDLALDEHDVRNHVRNILHKNPHLKGKIRTRNSTVTAVLKKRQTAAYLAKNPQASSYELAKALGVDQRKAGKLMTELADEYKRRNPEVAAGIYFDTIEKLNKLIDTMFDKLEKIKDPVKGVRHSEALGMLLEKRAKLVGITGPDVQVNQVIFTKEARDAAAETILAELEFKQSMRSPDFSKMKRANPVPVEYKPESDPKEDEAAMIDIHPTPVK